MSSKESGESLNTCLASAKERRKWCKVNRSNYQDCVEKEACSYANFNVNLGQSNLRGGIETSDDSTKWRHWKKVYGIAHGDD